MIMVASITGCGADSVTTTQMGIPKPRDAQESRVQGEYLVRVATTVADQADAEEAINVAYQAYGTTIVRQITKGLFLVRFTQDPGPEQVKRIADETEKIRYAEPNQIYRIQE